MEVAEIQFVPLYPNFSFQKEYVADDHGIPFYTDLVDFYTVCSQGFSHRQLPGLISKLPCCDV